jgi:transcriptional regulator GlxA family with amidase domain
MSARVETARLLLTETGLPLKAVAGRCGFPSVAALRRAFVLRLGVPPRQYRDKFASLEAAA